MHIENLDSLTRVLQASISPVALISGVGLLILSQTNRFTRVTDRLREMASEARETPNAPAEVKRQVDIFLQRARYLRLAIGYAITCVLLASVMILTIFTIAVTDWDLHLLVLLLFTVSLLSLISSLCFFLADTHLALRAVFEALKD